MTGPRRVAATVVLTGLMDWFLLGQVLPLFLAGLSRAPQLRPLTIGGMALLAVYAGWMMWQLTGPLPPQDGGQR